MPSEFIFRPSSDVTGAYLVYRRGHEQSFGRGFLGRVLPFGSTAWTARHRVYSTREAAARGLAAMGAWGGSWKQKYPGHSSMTPKQAADRIQLIESSIEMAESQRAAGSGSRQAWWRNLSDAQVKATIKGWREEITALRRIEVGQERLRRGPRGSGMRLYEERRRKLSPEAKRKIAASRKSTRAR
jgi:hypothetical protein